MPVTLHEIGRCVVWFAIQPWQQQYHNFQHGEFTDHRSHKRYIMLSTAHIFQCWSMPLWTTKQWELAGSWGDKRRVIKSCPPAVELWCRQSTKGHTNNSSIRSASEILAHAKLPDLKHHQNWQCSHKVSQRKDSFEEVTCFRGDMKQEAMWPCGASMWVAVTPWVAWGAAALSSGWSGCWVIKHQKRQQVFFRHGKYWFHRGSIGVITTDNG